MGEIKIKITLVDQHFHFHLSFVYIIDFQNRKSQYEPEEEGRRDRYRVSLTSSNESVGEISTDLSPRGASCSGKTLLAKHIRNVLPSGATILHQDDFAPVSLRFSISHSSLLMDYEFGTGAGIGADEVQSQ